MNFKEGTVEASLGTQVNKISESLPKINLPDLPNDPQVEKLRKIILIGLTALVAGGAAFLIILSLFSKFNA